MDIILIALCVGFLAFLSIEGYKSYLNYLEIKKSLTEERDRNRTFILDFKQHLNSIEGQVVGIHQDLDRRMNGIKEKISILETEDRIGTKRMEADMAALKQEVDSLKQPIQGP